MEPNNSEIEEKKAETITPIIRISRKNKRRSRRWIYR